MRRPAPASILLILGLAHTALAGPLDPPPGPISSTNKTLADVEPRTAISPANTPGDATASFVITHPGSYYLTANLVGETGRLGIRIQASNVSIDLAGFEVIGGGGAGTIDGIGLAPGGFSNFTIINGSVHGWPGDGIDLFTNAGSHIRIEGVQSDANAGSGIAVGSAAVIARCQTKSNAQHGFFVGGAGAITDSIATVNGGNGFNTATGCSIARCLAYQNSSSGISTSGSCQITDCNTLENQGHGIVTNSGCFIVGCAVRSNRFDGIQGGSSCTVRNNHCDANGNGGTGSGVHLTGSTNLVEDNNCTNADFGVSIDLSRNIIRRNTCGGNATNWQIAVGNAVGPIVGATTNTAVISGNTYAGNMGSTDPNANFTY